MQMVLGVKAKNALVHTIFEKSLKINNANNQKFSQAEVINFIQVDSDKILTV
jgi:hypothetical protein